MSCVNNVCTTTINLRRKTNNHRQVYSRQLQTLELQESFAELYINKGMNYIISFNGNEKKESSFRNNLRIFSGFFASEVYVQNRK